MEHETISVLFTIPATPGATDFPQSTSSSWALSFGYKVRWIKLFLAVSLVLLGSTRIGMAGCPKVNGLAIQSFTRDPGIPEKVMRRIKSDIEKELRKSSYLSISIEAAVASGPGVTENVTPNPADTSFILRGRIASSGTDTVLFFSITDKERKRDIYAGAVLCERGKESKFPVKEIDDLIQNSYKGEVTASSENQIRVNLGSKIGLSQQAKLSGKSQRGDFWLRVEKLEAESCICKLVETDPLDLRPQNGDNVCIEGEWPWLVASNLGRSLTSGYRLASPRSLPFVESPLPAWGRVTYAAMLGSIAIYSLVEALQYPISKADYISASESYHHARLGSDVPALYAKSQKTYETYRNQVNRANYSGALAWLMIGYAFAEKQEWLQTSTSKFRIEPHSSNGLLGLQITFIGEASK